jgi:hypothetical protein
MMSFEEAMQTVFDLASDNALDGHDVGDELYEEQERQKEALDIVYDFIHNDESVFRE